MHFTGTIWRPPYEASSLLLEVAAGCSHNKCKFCTLYHDLPFKFKVSPCEDIEEDLDEIKQALAYYRGRPHNRIFLTGANPFVLKFDRLMKIAELIHSYLPTVETIGSFSRITDIGLKTDEQLKALRQAGFDGLTIGVETGDDETLAFMNKGYQSADIITQCKRLEEAGIGYSFFYLTGISGAGRGEAGAKASAEVFNQLHPRLIGPNMMTVYPDSELFKEIEKGNWQEETEHEKYQEVKTLAENLTIPTTFATMGASNAFRMQCELPQDREALLESLDRIIAEVSEEELRHYRVNLNHL